MKTIYEFVEAPLRPEVSPNHEAISVVAYLDSETPAYQDAEARLLGTLFAPKSFKHAQGSSYGDATIEDATGFLAETGKLFNTYYGYDEATVDELDGYLSSHIKYGSAESFNPLRDVRIVEHKDTRIYFPTPELLVAYGVKMRALNDQQNATLRLLFSPYLNQEVALSAIAELQRSTSTNEFIKTHLEAARIIHTMILKGLEGKLAPHKRAVANDTPLTVVHLSDTLPAQSEVVVAEQDMALMKQLGDRAVAIVATARALSVSTGTLDGNLFRILDRISESVMDDADPRFDRLAQQLVEFYAIRSEIVLPDYKMGIRTDEDGNLTVSRSTLA